jgi:TP901 family phage tail tape measure protein
MAQDKLIFQIKADTTDIVRGVRGVNKEIGKTNKQVKSFTTGLTAGFAKVGLAMNGIQMGLQMVGSMLKPFTDFQIKMAEVNTLLGESGPQVAELSKEVLELSKRLPASTTELSEGLYEVISASIDSSEAIGFLETATRSATAGVTDVKTAVDGITTVLNAYGLSADEAGQVSDIMFTTVKRGKTTCGEMAQNLGQVIPVASSMGVEFEEVASAFATLTKNSMNTAMSSTALAGAITELSNPASNANKLLKRLTNTTGGQLIKTKGLIGTIKELGGASKEELVENFGRQGARAILILTNKFQMATDDLDAMRNALGATDEAFRKMEATVNFQSALLKNNFNAILIELGSITLPLLNSVMGGLIVVIQNWKKAIIALIGSLITFKLVMLSVNGSIFAGIKTVRAYRVAMVLLRRGIRTTTLSLKTLKATLISTGIGAGILLIGSAIEWLVGKADESTDAVDRSAEAIYGYEQAVRDASGYTELQSALDRIEVLDKEIGVRDKLTKKVVEGGEVETSRWKTQLNQGASLRSIQYSLYNDIAFASVKKDSDLLKWSLQELRVEQEKLKKEKPIQASDIWDPATENAMDKRVMDKSTEMGSYNKALAKAIDTIDRLIKKKKEQGQADDVSLEDLQNEKKALEERVEALKEVTSAIVTLTTAEQKLLMLQAERKGDKAVYNLLVQRRNALKKLTNQTTEQKIEQEKLQIVINRMWRGFKDSEKAEAKRVANIKDELALIKAKQQGIDDEIKFYQDKIDIMAEVVNMTAEEELAYENLRLKVIELNNEKQDSYEDEVDRLKDAEDRNYELGLTSFSRYFKILQDRKEALEGSIEDEQELKTKQAEYDDQLSQLAMERFGKLRGGVKEFLKGELIDKITSAQIGMAIELAKIFASESLTLGLTLVPKLAYYGAGIGLLETAKGMVQAFAHGGLVNQPTIGLLGEAGPEFVAPVEGFKEYAKKELTPMIAHEISLGNIALTGHFPGIQQQRQGPDITEMEKSLKELVKVVKGSPARTTVRGSDIIIAENRLKRGRL